MNKKISAIAFALMTTLAAAPMVHALEGDLKDLRPEVNKKEWQLVKNDTTRSIKTFIREGDGKRINFKVDAMIEGTLENVARVHFDVDNIKH